MGRPTLHLAVDANKAVVVAIAVVANRVAGSFLDLWEGVEQLLLERALGETQRLDLVGSVQAFFPCLMARVLERHSRIRTNTVLCPERRWFCRYQLCQRT